MRFLVSISGCPLLLLLLDISPPPVLMLQPLRRAFLRRARRETPFSHPSCTSPTSSSPSSSSSSSRRTNISAAAAVTRHSWSPPHRSSLRHFMQWFFACSSFNSSTRGIQESVPKPSYDTHRLYYSTSSKLTLKVNF